MNPVQTARSQLLQVLESTNAAFTVNDPNLGSGNGYV
jgi:hypothetical protein